MNNKYLGKLCARKHEYNGTGKSMRYRSNHNCIKCDKERKKNNRDYLSDSYVKSLIRKSLRGLKSIEIPSNLVDAKKAQCLLMRYLKYKNKPEKLAIVDEAYDRVKQSLKG